MISVLCKLFTQRPDNLFIKTVGSNLAISPVVFMRRCTGCWKCPQLHYTVYCVPCLRVAILCTDARDSH